ncbi:hypothetical protein LCGC14_2165790 [marine sediment metagenome]|uniref:Uncharacterized protein n=1 Tax=marine sediment metagenome TaxID=412755 RepID=A0A0F9DRK1_9ZZZZ
MSEDRTENIQGESHPILVDPRYMVCLRDEVNRLRVSHNTMTVDCQTQGCREKLNHELMDKQDATIATLRREAKRLWGILNPHGGMFSGESGSPEADWYEETIFNEERLYKSLGKEDARTVLYIWDRYRKAVEALATAQEE